MSDPLITSVATANNIPSDFAWDGTTVYEAGNRIDGEELLTCRQWVDSDMIGTFNIRILEGRNFHPKSRADSASVLINETMVNMLNFEEPIGKKIKYTDSQDKTYTVIGVVKDYHYQSLKYELTPLSLNRLKTPRRMVVKFESKDIPLVLAKLESLWNEFSSDHVFEYEFVDQRYDRFYKSEQRMGELFKAFVMLAIVIASMGLLGLSSLMTAQRKKEIGIRKVLGSSVGGIVVLLNISLTKTVIISLLIGIPTGFIIMNNWLEEFAYKIQIGIFPLLGAGLLCLIIAWMVVTYLTYQAARANPTDNLRYE